MIERSYVSAKSCPRGQAAGTSYAPIQSDASAESLTSDAPLCVNGLVRTSCEDLGLASATECDATGGRGPVYIYNQQSKTTDEQSMRNSVTL